MAFDNDSKRRGNSFEAEWTPVTDLGILVKSGVVTDIHEIFNSSLKIQEVEIVDFLLEKGTLKEEVLVIGNVQKQGKSGQQASKKAVVVVGNGNGLIGYGMASCREASDAIRKAISTAKKNIMPVRRGQWQGEGDFNHTLACQGSGKSGCKKIKLIPAPIGTGNAYGSIQHTIFQLAGINDIFVKSTGGSKNKENQVTAIMKAIQKSSSLYMPRDWHKDDKVVNLLTLHSSKLYQPGRQ